MTRSIPISNTRSTPSWTDALPKDGSFDVADSGTWFAKRAMQMNPEIEPNLRATIRGIVGENFTDGDLGSLQERALNAARIDDLPVLRGISGGVPVVLTAAQKARIDRLVGRMGSDPLGRRAGEAYQEGLKSGKIRIR